MRFEISAVKLLQLIGCCFLFASFVVSSLTMLLLCMSMTSLMEPALHSVSLLPHGSLPPEGARSHCTACNISYNQP